MLTMVFLLFAAIAGITGEWGTCVADLTISAMLLAAAYSLGP